MKDKFLNYSDDEMKELAELISLHFDSLQKAYAPALDLVSPETVAKHNKKFLLERKAVYLLDQEAIEAGFFSAAHREKDKAEKEAARLADEKAKKEALEKAAADKEKARVEAELKAKQELQDLRDKEDAENAAKEKARLAAELAGQDLAEK